ncbi:elongation factor P--(R)-beta-lysine ligase [Lacimicrobium alkaliphilum]|uniref:Elongation factor P--(R)-beta-lysine ligase n=1 Tax=Lacimicrobium alkaliphilum TaxID=1526571 RepID=A0ABQ1RH59_9ALTE|nr:elongation factor P--(R)-beta-lysine ligase [Lacimicrobium alkaliphilum]GGD70232.1 elongation factor P--(R)-beta-lysine ligase [Lacimicrobium alkaliphilum]
MTDPVGNNSWRPSAQISVLAQRAGLIAQIRQFFAHRKVMEVETPCLSLATVTDLHLQSFSTRYTGPGLANGKTLYLQTSPEFAMKRLLAAGSGSIYQICKAFRNEECGRFHNPEFTILEWYRPDFDHHQLMQELDELMQRICNTSAASRLSYQQAFVHYLNIDPLIADLQTLRQAVIGLGHNELAEHEEDKDTLLQLLFCEVIEPQIGRQAPCFIYDFPASQAALARLSPEDARVAERFELYYQGVELANGFHELTDADEQRQRFEQDNLKRRQNGKQEKPVDTHLLAALHAGLPDCAGVAVGIDRLMMLALGQNAIDDVISFGINHA